MAKWTQAEDAERRRNRRTLVRQHMTNIMGGACQCCGYNTDVYCLEIYPLPGHKFETKAVSGFTPSQANWDVFVERMRVGILVCQNCKRELNRGSRPFPQNYVKFDEKYAELWDFLPHANCKTCGKCIPQDRQYCSPACYNRTNQIVDWDTIDLLALAEEYTIEELATMLKVIPEVVRDKISEFQGRGYGATQIRSRFK